MKNLVLSLILVGGLLGCASAKKDYSYMKNSDYSSRSTLTRSLIDPGKPLNEDAIQKILNSKIKFPSKVSLAVTRLSSSYDFQKVDEEVADKFYAKENWGKRVQTVIPVPQVLVNYPINITGLRQSAVLLQADVLLVIMPYSYGNWKFQWFEKNKAKGTSSLEVLLLDVRTGVIPYTSIITESVEVVKEGEEYNNSELVMKAKLESEKKALIQVAKQISEFLTTIK